MKRSFTAIIAFLLVVGVTTAQTTVLDFEASATSTVFQYFGNDTLNGTYTSVVTNPDATGINTSSNVTMFVKSGNAQVWGGGVSDPNPSVPVYTNGGIISMDVYTPASGLTVRLKLEGSSAGQGNWEMDATTTAANQWETLTWDTNNPDANGLTATSDYATVVVFFDFGNAGTGSNTTYYFDNLTSTGTSAAPSPVTFSVDMSDHMMSNTFTTVNVNGTFNGWCGGCNEMTDPDGDSIYTVTLSLIDGPYEYKYTTDAWAGSQETFLGGEPCTVTNGGFTNRSINVSGTTSTIDYCWNTCDVCSAPPAVPDTVFFAVDMNQYPNSFGVVNVNGTFNGWCGPCFPLTDADGDNIWTGSMALFDGTYEFKYTVDGWTDEEMFAGGESCTVTNGGFTNREFTIAGANLDLGVNCFNSCSACVYPPDCSARMSGLDAIVLDSTQAAIVWDAHPDAAIFRARYRVKGTSTWTNLVIRNADYQVEGTFLSGLTLDETYEYRVRQQCADLTVSPYSQIGEFTTFTTSACEAPAASKVMHVANPMLVRLVLDYEPASDSYEVIWREAGTSMANSKVIKKSKTLISGLNPDTDYEYYVRVNCGGVWSDSTSWESFATNSIPIMPAAPPTPVAQRTDLEASTFSVYPNPTSNALFVAFEATTVPSYLRVFDATGALVRQIMPNDQLERLDVSALPKGMYYMQVVFENETVETKRFLKN